LPWVERDDEALRRKKRRRAAMMQIRATPPSVLPSMGDSGGDVLCFVGSGKAD